MLKRVLSISLVTAFFVTLFAGSVVAQYQDYFEQRLQEISSPALAKTLRNSIKAGLIEDPADFDRAVEYSCRSALFDDQVKYELEGNYSDSGVDYNQIRREIAEITADFAKLDVEAIDVAKTSEYKPGYRNHLFIEISQKIPKSYIAAYNLCLKFDPRHGTNDAPRLNREIDEFLEVIKDDPLIVKALRETNTTIQDLKKNWFGPGIGFEHVVAGEIRGTKVNGYHWWFKFYMDERKDKANAIESVYDIGNPHSFTGKFTWDPDKDGPLPSCYKSLGGFTLGNSVQAVLALGHVAIEVARRNGHVPQGLRFNADINGQEYSWQMYTVNGTIRSLYPLANKKMVINPPAYH